AVTFQSMLRMSSPGWYSRTASNSSPRPRKTEWYSPAKRSFTARLATISMRRTWRTTSATEAASMPVPEPPLRHRHRLQDAADHRVRVDLLRLRLVGEDQAVAQ